MEFPIIFLYFFFNPPLIRLELNKQIASNYLLLSPILDEILHSKSSIWIAVDVFRNFFKIRPSTNNNPCIQSEDYIFSLFPSIQGCIKEVQIELIFWTKRTKCVAICYEIICKKYIYIYMLYVKVLGMDIY